SFSQFGSDVDPETKKNLDQGKILMEIIKQGQYNPLDVAHQVMIIYAAINGLLKDIPLHEIKGFEKQLFIWVDDHYPHISEEIHTTGDLSADTEKVLRDAINEFKKAGYVNG
ncbi:MAG: F0F1 ATP synthase subunit alpha, partial [Clostridia bacterium]|nr:F0F1 ATP synthase subunit alpha [Clostridia bacterium]